MLLPLGPDNLPSLLGVEIDSGLIPTTFTDGGVASGDRIAVFGRWIVDCGHQIPITDFNGKDVAPGVQAFRSEIHPPLLMAAARVTNDSLVSGGPASPELTRVMFTSRPYLVSQRFTTDTSKAYDDNAPADGPFVPHIANEIRKVNEFSSLRIEAHPKIKSFPFRGDNLAHFIIRPPPQARTIVHPPLGRLHVSFQFTVRTGCSVQVISTSSGSVDVFIVMNHAGYTPPFLPKRNDRSWSKSELEDLNSRAGDAYRWGEGISAVIQGVLGTGVIGIAVVEAILNRDILSDQYDVTGVRSVNILDVSHPVSAFADSIPFGQGVITNNNQPYPIFGWLEAKLVPPVNV
jgi:hypothetical protein